LKERLDRLYETFDFEGHIAADPIEFPHRYTREGDMEVAGFISALFAYGRVGQFKAFLERVFSAAGESPHEFALSFRMERDGRVFSGLRYRFNSGADVALLFHAVHTVLVEHGSLGSFFMSLFRECRGDLKVALTRFVETLRMAAMPAGGTGRGFLHLLPSPLGGGACKRLNLFLRWMVRDRDIDFGLWKGIPADRLVIPLDTHIARIARCLGFTSRRSTGWKMAEEITGVLREYDPEDPLKYDFALCHQGISGICREDRSLCAACTLSAAVGS